VKAGHKRRLAGVAEVAGVVGVSRARASVLSRRADFPTPIDQLAMGPVWEYKDVERWQKQRR
jgi:predicted DNA-binding transcriptional regulator AlpA